MRRITVFNDLPDLALIDIFSYLSSLDILWTFCYFNQRIMFLLHERGYFRRINLSSAHHRQFVNLINNLPLNEIESLTIDIDASPLQLSEWPYLPCLKTLILKGIREFNDVLIFVLMHAATLTHLTIHTSKEFVAIGNSLKHFYPLGTPTLLVQNIIFRHLPSLQSIDLGTDKYNRMLYWNITSISAPLTYMRIVLNRINDLLSLISTYPLSKTLKELHVTLNNCWSCGFVLPTIDVLPRMIQLHTFTFAKLFTWKLDLEWELINILTTRNVMPMLRRANLTAVLTLDDIDHLNQSSIFIDSRAVDVHFAFSIDGHYELSKVKNYIPFGSVSHPKPVIPSEAFIVPYGDNMAYYRKNVCGHTDTLIYTFPWSFDAYFQLILPHKRFTQQYICMLPSINTVDSSYLMTVNENDNIFLPNNCSLVCKISLDDCNQLKFPDCHTRMNTTTLIHYMIVINNLYQLNSCLFPLNVCSINISLYLSSKIINSNWNSLRALSILPLLKSLRIAVHNGEIILDDKDCQMIVELLSVLTNFSLCFRKNEGPCSDNIDVFDVYCKSILNLRNHIFAFLHDQQSNVIIEKDGCGITVWL